MAGDLAPCAHIGNPRGVLAVSPFMQPTPLACSPQRTIDVVVTWAGTPLCVERLARAQTFTLGAMPPSNENASRHFLFHHPSLPSPAYPIVEHRADGAVVVRAAEGMALSLDGAPLDLDRAPLALGKGARARVQVGPLRIDVAGDKRAPTVVDTMRDIVDGRLLRLSGVAMALHAGFVIALLLTRAPDNLDDPLVNRNAPRWLSSPTLTSPRITPVVAERREAPKQPDASSARPRRALDTSKKQGGKPSNRDLALQAIAQMFASNDATSKVFGENGHAADLSGLRGATTAGLGTDAMGVRHGPGGLGNGATTVGGFDGRIGDGPIGGGGVLLRTKKDHVIVDVFAPPVQDGDGLTREEIQRVLKRVMPQIKYCYEKELNREPTLEGKITTNWSIAPTGAVSRTAIAALTMQKPGGDAVSACVTRILQRLQFPEPRNGGTVMVTYPFVFSSSGR